MNLSYSTKLYPCFVILQKGGERKKEKENRKAGKMGDEGDRENYIVGDC